MKRARFSEEQIIGILKAAEAVGNIRQACRENNITEQTFYRWRRKFGGNRALGVADDAIGLARIRHMPVIDEDGPVIGLISKRVLFQGALARALGYGEFAQKKRLGIMRVK
ncbi:MAG TPA: hypothetical protein EYQ60_05560 [Myxococcales bacterium]|nr:hypothetical protein [Myxococcales bacterium]